MSKPIRDRPRGGPRPGGGAPGGPPGRGDGRGRGDERHIVTGPRAIAELLDAAPRRVRELLIASSRSDDEVIERARALGINVREADQATLAKLAIDGPAKGMVAIADPPELVELDTILAESPTLLIALDGVGDPHNKGAILRTAEFFGAAGVFWPKDGSAPLSPSAVRAAAGATERLAMASVVNLARALQECKDAEMWIVGTVAEGGMPLTEAAVAGKLPDRLVVVLGGEHAGLRRLTRDVCDFLVTIERTGHIASLNVSTAAAVVLAALSRRGT